MPKLLKFEPGGVGEYFTPSGVTTVYTSTCAHCEHQTEFPSKRQMMQHVDICRGCMRLICLGCVGKPCRPWEKELERQEAEGELRRKLDAQAWWKFY